MGGIAGAGLLSHVPAIILPGKTRRALNEGNEISLMPGLEGLRREVLDEFRLDTLVVFDTHWLTTVEFVVTAHERHAGRYTSEELPRVIRRLPYDLAGDPALASPTPSPHPRRPEYDVGYAGPALEGLAP